MDSEKLQKYVSLAAERDHLEHELETVKKEMEGLQTEIIDQAAKIGWQSTKLGTTTVYLRRQLWASPENGDHDGLAKALTDAGHPELAQVRVNSNTLSALVREYDEDGRELPEAVKAKIKVSEKFTLATRKS